MDEPRPILRFDEKTDNKGNKFWKPVYLTQTPDAEILRINKIFPVRRS